MRRPLGTVFVKNSTFENIPAFTAAQTASNFINGTAAGSKVPTYGWLGAGLAASRTAQFTTEDKHSGTGCIKLTQTGTSTAFGITTATTTVSGTTTPIGPGFLVPVKPSTGYTLSAWFKANKPTTGVSQGAQIKAWEYNSMLSTAYNGTDRNSGTFLDGSFDWTQQSFSFTTSSTCNALNILAVFTSTDNTSYLYVDDIELKKSTAVTRSAA